MDLNNALNRELSKPHHDINVYNKDGLMLGSNRGAYEDLRENLSAPWIIAKREIKGGSIDKVRSYDEELTIKFDDEDAMMFYILHHPPKGAHRCFQREVWKNDDNGLPLYLDWNGKETYADSDPDGVPYEHATQEENCAVILESTSVSRGAGNIANTANGQVWATVTRKWSEVIIPTDQNDEELNDETPPWMYRIEKVSVSSESTEEMIEEIYPDCSYYSAWVAEAFREISDADPTNTEERLRMEDAQRVLIAQKDRDDQLEELKESYDKKKQSYQTAHDAGTLVGDKYEVVMDMLEKWRSRRNETIQKEYRDAIDGIEMTYLDDKGREHSLEHYVKRIQEKLDELTDLDITVPFRNAAGRMLEGQKTRETLRLSFEYNAPDWDFSAPLKYKNRINKYPVQIAGIKFPPRTVLISDLGAEFQRDFDDDGHLKWEYWTISVSLSIDEKTFNKKYANAGQHVLDNVRYKILDNDAKTVIYEVPHYRLKNSVISHAKFSYRYDGLVVGGGVCGHEIQVDLETPWGVSQDTDLRRLGTIRWYRVDEDGTEIPIERFSNQFIKEIQSPRESWAQLYEYMDKEELQGMLYKDLSYTPREADVGYYIKFVYEGRFGIGSFSFKTAWPIISKSSATSRYPNSENFISDGLEMRTQEQQDEYNDSFANNNYNKDTYLEDGKVLDKDGNPIPTGKKDIYEQNKYYKLDISEEQDPDIGQYKSVIYTEYALNQHIYPLYYSQFMDIDFFWRLWEEVKPYAGEIEDRSYAVNVCSVTNDNTSVIRTVTKGVDPNSDLYVYNGVPYGYTEYLRTSLSPVYFYQGQYYNESQVAMMGIKEECENDAITEPMFLNIDGTKLNPIRPDGRQQKSYLKGSVYEPVDFSELGLPEVG